MNSLEKKATWATTQLTGQTCGVGDPDREGAEKLFPSQRFPRENDHTVIRDLDEERNAGIDPNVWEN